MPGARARIDVRILWREFVTSLAMGLFGIKATSTVDVLLRSYRFKMGWITATPCAAKMIQLKIWRDGATKELVTEPMDVDVLITDYNDAVIASTSHRAHPQPAASVGLNVNLISDSFRKGR